MFKFSRVYAKMSSQMLNIHNETGSDDCFDAQATETHSKQSTRSDRNYILLFIFVVVAYSSKSIGKGIRIISE